MPNFTIELDCAPGPTRPGHLMVGIVEKFGLDFLDPEKPQSKLFGNWTWVVPDENSETYEKVQEQVGEHIRDLYKQGSIRYGSW